jgi:hypothetical protein
LKCIQQLYQCIDLLVGEVIFRHRLRQVSFKYYDSFLILSVTLQRLGLLEEIVIGQEDTAYQYERVE